MENHRSWKYTWEAQSQLPIMKLFLFSHGLNPSVECRDLHVEVKLEISVVEVSWIDSLDHHVCLRIPVPKVLVDLEESGVQFRTLDDHIELKIGLLLSVDHPIVSQLFYQPPSSKPLILESDVERLAAKGESHLYCRKCSFQLTQRPMRSFAEMASVDWREAADNWFDAGCCSFGGISEKMVASYAKSHASTLGSGLVSTSSITLYQNDLIGFNSSSYCDSAKSPDLRIPGTSISFSTQAHDHFDTCCTVSQSSSKDQEIINTVHLSLYQKLLLNGYLGDVFMVTRSGLSNDIEWIEFDCPKCSSLLGVYPSADGHTLIDGGIRLLKCYISTSPSDTSGDVFRKYTLDRMFSARLMENANDELSFRTAVKGLKTQSLMLQMVLLNPDTWHCNGSCEEGSIELNPVLYLHPVVKVLFSVSSTDDSQPSLSVRQRKDQIEEVFMLDVLIKQIRRSLKLSSSTLPTSLTSLQGFSLSVLRR